MSADNQSVHLSVDAEILRPLVEQVVCAALAKLEADRAQLGDRLAYSEPEAARMLGLNAHQLRDERLRRRITASQVVGKRVRYLRQDLVDYLMQRRLNDSK